MVDVVSPEQPRFFSWVSGAVLRRPSSTGPAYPRSFWSPVVGWRPAASESPSARYQPEGVAEELVGDGVGAASGRGPRVGDGGGVVIVARMPSGSEGAGAAPEQPPNTRAAAAASAATTAAGRAFTGTACHARATRTDARPTVATGTRRNRRQTPRTRSKRTDAGRRRYPRMP